MIARNVAVAVAAPAAAAAAYALHRVEPAAFDAIALYASARLVATGRGGLVTDAAAIHAVEREAAPERVAYLNNPNLPAVSGILAPLGALPFEAAYLVMLALGVAALVAAALLLRPRSPAAAVLVLIAPPSILALAHGQTTPFVLAALLASERLPPVASGVLRSAALLRPQLFPLVAVASAGRHRRGAALLAGVAVIVALSVAIAGVDGMRRYPALVMLAAGELGNNEVGLAPWVLRLAQLGASPAAATANILVSVVLLALGAVAVLTSRREVALPTACVWSLIGGAHVLMHDLLFAYPAVAALERGRGLVALAGTLCVLAQLGGIPLVPLWLALVAFMLRAAGGGTATWSRGVPAAPRRP